MVKLPKCEPRSLGHCSLKWGFFQWVAKRHPHLFSFFCLCLRVRIPSPVPPRRPLPLAGHHHGAPGGLLPSRAARHQRGGRDARAGRSLGSAVTKALRGLKRANDLSVLWGDPFFFCSGFAVRSKIHRVYAPKQALRNG